MKRLIIALSILTMAALPAFAAPTNTSGPWGIDAGGFKNLSTALASPVTVGKAVVISESMAINNKVLPVDRHIRVILGGRIDPAAGKTFNYNGQTPEAGQYQIHGGAGSFAGLKEVFPEWFGPVDSDAGPAINKAAEAVRNGGSIELTKTKYLIGTTVKFPLDSQHIRLFSKVNSQLIITTNIDCLDISATNENYGWHTIEGITLTGLNNYYAKTMTLSTGTGIRMQRDYSDMANTASAYNTVIRDVTIQKFKYGIRMRSAIKTRIYGKTTIRQNRYGIFFDGGMNNANNFDGLIISTNDTAGIFSAGTSGGTLTDSTNNVFTGCLLESNHPHLETGGTAIYLNKSYDYIFNGCYSEDHQYSIHLTNGASGNKFIGHRTAAGGAGMDAIYISGDYTWNNSFTECKAANLFSTDVNVISDSALQQLNRFINCEGYNFIAGKVLSKPYIVDMRSSSNYSDMLYAGHGMISMPPHGSYENVGEGTTPARIEGIGTETAILHCKGFGELAISSLVGAAATNTTITTFEGLTPGQIFVLWNYQTTRTVTIKTGPRYGAIVLKGAPSTDAVFTDYGQMIVFWVTQGGKAYEIGRNF